MVYVCPLSKPEILILRSSRVTKPTPYTPPSVKRDVI